MPAGTVRSLGLGALMTSAGAGWPSRTWPPPIPRAGPLSCRWRRGRPAPAAVAVLLRLGGAVVEVPTGRTSAGDNLRVPGAAR
ncbi:hypothetical protein [Streptomyces sp. CC224B]|uniref:hypothetical protein n=1 Tax=Streptomyces sp. CC224B TaxID=3044571 RepID=UPI0024A98473|nr:hypothetical protein [Streptomyces sp. CC224B]